MNQCFACATPPVYAWRTPRLQILQACTRHLPRLLAHWRPGEWHLAPVDDSPRFLDPKPEDAAIRAERDAALREQYAKRIAYEAGINRVTGRAPALPERQLRLEF